MNCIKISKGFLLFSLLTLPCRSASAMPPEASALFEKAGVTLTDADLYRVAEVYNFWSQKGESIWPGVDMTTVPIQIVFPEKLNVLMGHPNPPPGCVMADIILPGINKAFCHRPDRSFLYGGATGLENKFPVVSLNTMDLYDAFIKDYFKKNNIAFAPPTKSYLQYLGGVAHELIHAHQELQLKYLPRKERNSRPTKLNKGDYPCQDEETALLLGFEGRILADIMNEKDPEQLRGLWRDFTAVRTERRRRLPRDIVTIEQYLEFTEGAAQYVGMSVELGNNSDVRPLAETLADPRFTGYASSDTFHETLTQSLLTLESPIQGSLMRYVYITGTALAYNMDKAAPGWKKNIFREKGGFKSGLDDLITANIKPERNTDERRKAVYARYKGDEMRARVRLALEKDLADNKVKLDKFRAAPGKRCLFGFDRAKPADILAFAPALLTEYKELRVYEAGITKIMCNSGKRNEKSLVFSKAIPILQNRETGCFELALPEGSKPAIKAENTVSKNGATIYSGGVEFDNGVFSWKGKKLVVTEKDGVTTLIF